MKTTLRSIVRGSVMASLMMAALLVGTPLSAYAATYAYVNTSGTLTYIEASSSADAFSRSTNRNPDSGVMLVGPDAVVATGSLSGYLYVNTSGQVTRVSATGVAGAFAAAKNIAPNSGVMPIDTAADSNMVGDHVSGS